MISFPLPFHHLPTTLSPPSHYPFTTFPLPFYHLSTTLLLPSHYPFTTFPLPFHHLPSTQLSPSHYPFTTFPLPLHLVPTTLSTHSHSPFSTSPVLPLLLPINPFYCLPLRAFFPSANPSPHWGEGVNLIHLIRSPEISHDFLPYISMYETSLMVS